VALWAGGDNDDLTLFINNWQSLYRPGAFPAATISSGSSVELQAFPSTVDPADKYYRANLSFLQPIFCVIVSIMAPGHLRSDASDEWPIGGEFIF